MPFLATLQSELQPDGRWELLQPLPFWSRRYGQLITADTGFVMDYASVPRIPFVFAALGNAGHLAATIHDEIYKNGHGVWTRAQADRIFLDALLETESRWRAYAMYAGVRAGGWRAWRKHRAAFYA